MNKNNISKILILLISTPLFSQGIIENKEISKSEIKTSYLDSIKSTFVKNEMASELDSLWTNELTSLDIYNNISNDIKTINIDKKVDFELPTSLLKERLTAMDAKTPFDIEYNQELENIIKSFLKNRKKSFERLMAISDYYFPMFEEAMAKKNIPLEIKYLAVVESALNPKAVSKMGATGLWQFMYETGKQYSLKIDSYIDERSDPLKSSEAAAEYMSKMFAVFNDWNLVLASYNSGPGNVTKAIRRSGGHQNYWNIRSNLPKETQGYVPAFLATMYIFEYHNEHGIRPDKSIVKHFTTDTIMIKQQISFKQISELLDVPITQLQLLNPSYKMNVVPFYQDQPHFLRLPKDKIGVFASNEQKIYAYIDREKDSKEKPFQKSRAVAQVSQNENANGDYVSEKVIVPVTKFYKVRHGDNLSGIASKHNVAVADIKKWNQLKSNTVPNGKSLKIITNQSIVRSVKKVPSEIHSNTEKVAVLETKTNKEVSSTDPKDYYVVQQGDNLESIAKKNKVTVEEIKEWNHLSNSPIQSGTPVKISKIEIENKGELASGSVEIENIEYVVKKGDYLGNIANLFGTSIATLRYWNSLPDNEITPGSTLIVAKNKVVATESFSKNDNLASESDKKSFDYFVQKGDSLYSISKKYPGVSVSDIKKWNDINEKELKPGMKLKING